MTEAVPINISETARKKTGRLLSVNEIREALWDLDAPVYLDTVKNYYHTKSKGMIIIFTIDLDPHFRVAVVTQTHHHENYTQNDRFERCGQYNSAWEIAHDVRS